MRMVEVFPSEKVQVKSSRLERTWGLKKLPVIAESTRSFPGLFHGNDLVDSANTGRINKVVSRSLSWTSGKKLFSCSFSDLGEMGSTLPQGRKDFVCAKYEAKNAPQQEPT